MISSTIPDKLLVTSFLYNMHQYFTKAMPSAIAKDSSQSGEGSLSQCPVMHYSLCIVKMETES